jgi:hypothetical protein
MKNARHENTVYAADMGVFCKDVFVCVCMHTLFFSGEKDRKTH